MCPSGQLCKKKGKNSNLYTGQGGFKLIRCALIGTIRFAVLELPFTRDLKAIRTFLEKSTWIWWTSEAPFPFHNLSYELLHATIEFVMFVLCCISILGANGAVWIFPFFHNCPLILVFCTSAREQPHVSIIRESSHLPGIWVVTIILYFQISELRKFTTGSSFLAALAAYSLHAHLS